MMPNKTDKEILAELRAKRNRSRDVPLEQDIETEAVKAAHKEGWLSYKFTSPAHRSVPDRIFIKHGFVVFIEFKRPGAKATPNQEREIARMREHGASVHVCDSVKSVMLVLGVWL